MSIFLAMLSTAWGAETTWCPGFAVKRKNWMNKDMWQILIIVESAVYCTMLSTSEYVWKYNNKVKKIQLKKILVESGVWKVHSTCNPRWVKAQGDRHRRQWQVGWVAGGGWAAPDSKAEPGWPLVPIYRWERVIDPCRTYFFPLFNGWETLRLFSAFHPALQPTEDRLSDRSLHLCVCGYLAVLATLG